MAQTLSWSVTSPFVDQRTVVAGDIDAFHHVNNIRYIDWALDVAWKHSAALGLTFTDYKRLGVGCVVRSHEFEYKAPAQVDDKIAIATWISENDNRVRLTRSYELRHAVSDKLLFQGRTFFVCMDIETGKPVRMPKEFVEAYKPVTS